MSGQGNGHDDELTPTVGIVIGHPQNREILSFLANNVLELQEHTRIVTQLYMMLRDLETPITPKMRGQLVDEYERHHTADSANLAALKLVAG